MRASRNGGSGEDLLTVDEAAAKLHFKASTLYRWAEEKRLPVVKLGRSIRFRPEDIERLISKNLRPAVGRQGHSEPGLASEDSNA